MKSVGGRHDTRSLYRHRSVEEPRAKKADAEKKSGSTSKVWGAVEHGHEKDSASETGLVSAIG